MAELKEGTVVQLKSGGPKMTCMRLDTEGRQVTCQWFAGTEAKIGSFPAGSLDIVNGDDGQPDKKQ